jgi:16S rRNA (adenine1518-N6/adenine1519-N6)-dimethyltransferase
MTDELLDVVNENDEIIGEATREECYAKGLLHRGVIMFVENKKGEILLQMRANTQKNPHMLTVSASGHMDKGEGYYEAAKREMQEEIGITEELIALGPHDYRVDFKDGTKDYENSVLYYCKHEGPFNVQKEEVEWVKFYAIEKINVMLNENKEQFALGFPEEFKAYLKYREKQ